MGLGPSRPEVEMNHVINRETVFYTSDKGLTFERKTCDFYIYGRNEATKNRVIVIGSAVNLNLTPFVGKKNAPAKISFPESKAQNLYIEVEWTIVPELEQKPIDLDDDDLRSPSLAPGMFASVVGNDNLTEEVARLKIVVEEAEHAKHKAHDELNKAQAEMEGMKATIATYEKQLAD